MSTRNDLMRHALGVQEQGYGNRWSKPYRNHFVAGAADEPAWRALVVEGMAAVTREGNELTGNCPVFYVTKAGQLRALAGITFKRRWGYGKPVNP